MKGSIEYAVLFLWSCLMLTLLIQFSNVASRIHTGHLYLNYLINIVEDYDGDIELVKKHISRSSICDYCKAQFNKLENRYEIDVSFPIEIKTVTFLENVNISGITSSFE